LARAAGRVVERMDAKQLRARLGEAVHQGIVAEVAPLAAWGEEVGLDIAAQIQDGARRRTGMNTP